MLLDSNHPLQCRHLEIIGISSIVVPRSKSVTGEVVLLGAGQPWRSLVQAGGRMHCIPIITLHEQVTAQLCMLVQANIFACIIRPGRGRTKCVFDFLNNRL